MFFQDKSQSETAIVQSKTVAKKPAFKGRKPKFIFYIALFIGAILLTFVARYFSTLYNSLAYLVSLVENPYQQWLEGQNTNNPLILIPLAFIGGLIASVSPCILSLLPVNLSYIGTLKINSRRDAFVKAGLFVLGVMTVFSLFGLFASFASAILVEFRGIVNLIVGAVILLMGLSFAGLIHLPLPQTNVTLPVAGPYGVGLTFALVSSPCASPVLFAVLTAAAASGSQIISIVTMLSYAVGYTAVIFFASLFTGLIKQSRRLLQHSDWVIKLGSATLILAGGYYLVSGIGWFF